MFRLEVVSECGSTNDELFARRDEPEFAGLALLALRQTAGHGRRGREWWSGEGNLALSVGFRFRAGGEIALLPFRAGIALAEALAEFLPATADIRLKWPNDVYVNGKKISGLLSQARQAGEDVDLVLGMGVNLRAVPPELDSCAVSDWAPAPGPEEFAKVLLGRLKEKLANAGFASLKAEWEKHARIAGAKLTILGEEGEFEGVGLLPTGELEVRDGAGNLRRLSSETVSLRFV
jgi:BirA family biotin operon repressor/biotin-[acetyl-CoA-carboxylase] ligase